MEEREEEGEAEGRRRAEDGGGRHDGQRETSSTTGVTNLTIGGSQKTVLSLLNGGQALRSWEQNGAETSDDTNQTESRRSEDATESSNGSFQGGQQTWS